MKIQTIEYFISVAKSLSFTKGAQENYIAQPAMSRQIALIESKIGVTLFDRNCKSVKLTRAGEIFLEGAQKIIDLYYKTLEKTRETEISATNKIRIGIDHHEHNLLRQIVNELKEMDTTVQLVIKQYPFAELLSELINEKIDIIFGLPILSEDIESEVVKIIKVSPFNTDVILNRSHHLTEKDYINLQELNGETLITFSEVTGPFAFDKLKRLLESYGFKTSNVIHANSLESQVLMVSMGLGFAIIPDFCDNYNHMDVKRVPVRGFPIMDYTCAYLSNITCKSFSLLIDIISSVSKSQYEIIE